MIDVFVAQICHAKFFQQVDRCNIVGQAIAIQLVKTKIFPSVLHQCLTDFKGISLTLMGLANGIADVGCVKGIAFDKADQTNRGVG